MPPQKNAKIASKLLILLKADFRKWRELSNSGGRHVAACQEEPADDQSQGILRCRRARAAGTAIHRDDDDMLALQGEGRKLRGTANASRFLTANARWHRAMAPASHNPVLTAIYDALGPGFLNPGVAGFASAEIRLAVVRPV